MDEKEAVDKEKENLERFGSGVDGVLFDDAPATGGKPKHPVAKSRLRNEGSNNERRRPAS